MAEISNRTLATLLVAAIVISLGGTIISLNKLAIYVPLDGPTGRAPSDTGTTSVTIQQQVSIILQDPPGSSVDFGTGRVNQSKCTYSNMLAGTGGYTDIGDCWLELVQVTPPQAWRLENDGSLNASVAIRGPEENAFLGDYDSYGAGYPRGLRWRVNVSDQGCYVDRNESWSQFSWNSTACNNMAWDENFYDDDFAVEVNLTVPGDISGGTYSDDQIEFYAVASTWS